MSLSRLFTYSPAVIELYFAGLSADTQLGMGCKDIHIGHFALFRFAGKATHLDIYMVIRAEEQWDGKPLLAAFIYGSVNGRPEDII
jgi:hypothetical protein